MTQKDRNPDTSADLVCECKVARKASEYGFEDFFRRLPDLWLGKESEEHSLRELQKEINVSILRSALEDVDEDTIAGEVESRYDVLTSDEYTTGEKTEVENYLRSKGVDVEKVCGDFVSHQSVANHFYDCLEEKKGRSPSEGGDIKNIRSLERMAEDRLKQIVEKRRNSDEIEISEDYRIKVDFYVVNSDGSQKKIIDLIEELD